MIETRIIEAGSSPIGTEFIGLSLRNIGDTEVRQRLLDAWVEHGLIVARGVEGPEMQIALSEVFGPCIQHPGKPLDESKAHYELVNIRYARETGDIYEVNGKPMGAWLPWHSDLIYVDRINHGGVIRPIKMPKTGGETGFIDKIKLYETLDPELRERIEDKSIYYKWDLDVANQRFGRQRNARVLQWSENRRDMQSRLDQYPTVVHPAVFVQAETGRKVLNISPWFALGIQGMENEEGDALLEAVIRHCSDEKYAYFHHYRPDDMVAWDNWRMLHCGTGMSADETRWVARTTIAGDYELGRLVDENAVIDDRIRQNV